MPPPRMMPPAIPLLLLLLLSYALAESIFDFSVEDGRGELVPLSKFQDSKVILIVNTASYCGYTVSNYEQLQDMYSRLHPKGLEILAFPCVHSVEQHLNNSLVHLI